MTFLVLHGGPGLNSFPERAILGPRFEAAGHAVHFWNEPSRLRPDGDPFHRSRAFEGWMASAERELLARSGAEPVSLIAHGAAASLATELARRHPRRVSSLMLISPCADPFAAFRNILDLAQECAAERGFTVAAQLAECELQTRELLDDAMRRGFHLVLQNPPLLFHVFARYWSDQERFQAAIAAQACPEAQFDEESFFSVLEDFCARGDSLKSPTPVYAPVLALFAEHDPVCKPAEQSETIRAEVPDSIIENVQGCGHFLHLEQPDAFVQRTLAWASSAAARPRVVMPPSEESR